jgi:hypothetical protein
MSDSKGLQKVEIVGLAVIGAGSTAFRLLGTTIESQTAVLTGTVSISVLIFVLRAINQKRRTEVLQILELADSVDLKALNDLRNTLGYSPISLAEVNKTRARHHLPTL